MDLPESNHTGHDVDGDYNVTTSAPGNLSHILYPRKGGGGHGGGGRGGGGGGRGGGGSAAAAAAVSASNHTFAAPNPFILVLSIIAVLWMMKARRSQ